MVAMQRVVKPRNKRSQRALEAREPKAVEGAKKVALVRGAKCSEKVQRVLKDIHAIKRPLSDMFGRKHDVRPMEDATPLETMLAKADAGLFVFGNHNKKRPDNLILGSTFDGRVLDMFELGVLSFTSLAEFKNSKVAAESKPCLLFSGEGFQASEEMRRLKAMLIDLFRGPEVANVRLAGVEHALQFTAPGGDHGQKVFVRSYKIHLKRSDKPKVPRVELEEIGPALNVVLRRTHLASEDHYKHACKQVKNVRKKKKVKNVEEDVFGSTLGRLHVQAQDVNNVQTRKMKGLKEGKKAKEARDKDKGETARRNAVEAVFGDEEEAEEEVSDEEEEEMDTE